MILITHDLGVVAGRTEEVAVMYAGRIVEFADTQTLFADMRHPYTEALFESIPKIEHPSHTRLRAIAGRPPDLVDPPGHCAFAARCRYRGVLKKRHNCATLTTPDIASPVTSRSVHQRVKRRLL